MPTSILLKWWNEHSKIGYSAVMDVDYYQDNEYHRIDGPAETRYHLTRQDICYAFWKVDGHTLSYVTVNDWLKVHDLPDDIFQLSDEQAILFQLQVL